MKKLYGICFGTAVALVTATGCNKSGSDSIQPAAQLYESELFAGQGQKVEGAAELSPAVTESLQKNRARAGIDFSRTNGAQKPRLIPLGGAGYEPRASGEVPKANRKDLYLPKFRATHVMLGTAEAKGAFGIQPTESRWSAALETELDSDLVYGFLLPGALDNLRKVGKLKLPILIQAERGYRAQTVCLSDAAGNCERDLNRLLSDRFESIAKNLPFFSSLENGAELDGLEVKKRYLKIGFQRLRNFYPKNENQIRGYFGVIHPGENPHIESFIDGAMDAYRQISAGKATSSLAEFIARLGFAHCDMMAQAIAFRSGNAAKIANGNLVTSKTVDIMTVNHAWNFEQESNRFSPFDRTPAESLNWRYFFTAATARHLVDRLQASNYNDFSIQKVLSEERGAKLQSRFWDTGRDAVEKLQNKALISVIGATDLNEPKWIDSTKGIAYDARVNLIVNWGPVGRGIKPLSPPQNLDFHEFSAADVVPRGVFWTGNFDFSEKHPITETVSVSQARSESMRGYRWPTLSEKDLAAIKPKFFGTFSQLPGGERGPDTDKVGTSHTCPGAAGTIHAFYNTDSIYCDKLNAISTDALVDFWRSNGFKVYPRYEINLDLLTYFP